MSARPRRVAGRPTSRLRAAEVEKALPAQLASTGGQVRGADQIQALLQQRAMRGGLATPLPRDPYPYPFGPNIPLNPAPLDPTRPSGRAEPRLWEYPVSWNLPGDLSGRAVPWRTLRDASRVPLVRAAITARKDEVAGLEWDITLAPRAVDQAMTDQPGVSRLDVEADLRNRLRDHITRARAFWAVPDRGNGLTFTEWISQALEEHLVLDALPIYPRMTLGGQMYSLEIVDGATIKPLLDHRGGRPLPPQPAYQQIIHGFPRGEFTADTSDMGGALVIPDAYRADQLIYVRREVRVATPYGLSSVEKCLLDLDLWMKRQGWLRSEYDEGVMPAGWFVNEQTGDTWTPGQVAEYERLFNDLHVGSTAERMRYRMLPPGIKPAETSGHDIAEMYKPEFDLHLMKLVGMHFAVTAHELGFPEQTGIGGAGHAEGQDRLNQRKGRLPLLRWLAAVLTDISRAHLQLPPELEFHWLGVEDEDGDTDEPSTLEKIAAGLMTLNEGRDEDGRARYGFSEADKPAIIASGQVQFLEGIEQRQAEQQEAEAEVARARLGGGQDGKPEDDAPGDEEPDQAKAAEAGTYHRWAARNPTPARRFTAKHLTVADLDVYGVDPDRIVAAGGGVLGKGLWPGWGPDLDLIRAVTPRLQEAANRGVDVAALAAAWVAYQQGQAATGQQPVGDALAAAAVTWVTGRVLTALANAFMAPLGLLSRAAWLLGATSARAVLGEHTEGPGTRPSTGRMDEMDADRPAAELRDLAEQVAATVADRVARDLAGHTEATRAARDFGAPEPTVEDLTARLEVTVGGRAAAERIAVTETSRYISTASETNYAAFGVTRKRWIVAPDQRVCPRCDANAAQGAIEVGTAFSSGDLNPPAHPRCRCALLPLVDLADLLGDEDELGKKANGDNSLRDYWLHGEGATRWTTWTQLYHHLREHVGAQRAKRIAAQWFHERYGYWPGDRRNKEDEPG